MLDTTTGGPTHFGLFPALVARKADLISTPNMAARRIQKVWARPDMSITLALNRLWGFHVIRFEDRVTFDELVRLGRLHQSLPSFAAVDAIHIIDENADMSALSLEHVDALRGHYTKLQRGIEFYMVRRAEWVCATAEACRIVEYWLAGRHSRDGQGTEVCLAASLAEITPLFSEEEIDAVEAWSDFTELARIDG